MKPIYCFIFAVCAAITIASFSCKPTSKDIFIDDSLSNKTTSIHRIDSVAPSQDPTPLSYQEYVAAHPDIFGQNCMYFTSEAQMEAVYDSVSELGWTELAHWAAVNGITNDVIASNIVYDSILSVVEEALNVSFIDGISSELISDVCAELVDIFSNDESGYISITDSSGISTYGPQEMMSLKVFCNSNNLFVVDSTIYYFFPDGDGEVMIDLDTITNDLSTLRELHNVFNIEDYFEWVNEYGLSPYLFPSQDPNNNPRLYVRYLKNDYYLLRLGIESFERPRICNKSRRYTLVNITNYILSGDKRIETKLKTHFDAAIESRDYEGDNSVIHLFNYTQNFKSKEYQKSTKLNSQCRSSFVHLPTLHYNIYTMNIYNGLSENY